MKKMLSALVVGAALIVSGSGCHSAGTLSSLENNHGGYGTTTVDRRDGCNPIGAVVDFTCTAAETVLAVPTTVLRHVAGVNQ